MHRNAFLQYDHQEAIFYSVSPFPPWNHFRSLVLGNFTITNAGHILQSGFFQLWIPLSHLLQQIQDSLRENRGAVSESLWPHGLQPTRLLCPWGFSRQEHWSGLPRPPLGNLSNPGIEPSSPALQADVYQLSHQGSPRRLDWVFPTQ